jgi:hypothetical protein
MGLQRDPQTRILELERQLLKANEERMWSEKERESLRSERDQAIKVGRAKEVQLEKCTKIS